jgi:hypothetical protein
VPADLCGMGHDLAAKVAENLFAVGTPKATRDQEIRFVSITNNTRAMRSPSKTFVAVADSRATPSQMVSPGTRTTNCPGRHTNIQRDDQNHSCQKRLFSATARSAIAPTSSSSIHPDIPHHLSALPPPPAIRNLSPMPPFNMASTNSQSGMPIHSP